MQASLLASAALTVEVDTLKQNLERSEQELERVKKYLVKNIYIKRCNCKE